MSARLPVRPLRGLPRHVRYNSASTSAASSSLSAPSPPPRPPQSPLPDLLPNALPHHDMPEHLVSITRRRLRQHDLSLSKMSEQDRARLEAAMQRVQKDTARPKVDYETGIAGASVERRAFFADGEVEGGVEEGEEIPGLEVGRVVEVRRSGQTTIGLILSHILVAGRPRLLLLRPTGEIWPVSASNVQFAMPASLVPAHIAASVWDPTLLSLWSRSSDVGIIGGAEADLIGKDEWDDMLAARRDAAVIMRRVTRETDKMRARLVAGGGADTVWAHFAPEAVEERGRVTTVDAAQVLLDAGRASDAKPVVVRPNTLSAFAAHTLLMARPDLFVADETDMWSSSTLLVRSRAEVARLTRVGKLIETRDPVLVAFFEKVDQVRAGIIVEWTDAEKDILHVLLLRLYETRSTQVSPAVELSVNALVELKKQGSSITEQTTYAFLVDAGVVPRTDSLTASALVEGAERRRAMQPATFAPGGESSAAAAPAIDASLDTLRTDLSDTVYVIDDPTAIELDDGVALSPIEGSSDVWVHIHVADASAVVTPSTPEALAASYKGTATYLPEGAVPLFPAHLGLDRLSLRTAQGTLVVSVRVGEDGDVKDTKVGLGWAKDVRVVSYGAVNDALGLDAARTSYPFGRSALGKIEAASLPEKDVAALSCLSKIATALRARRFKDAGLEYSFPSGSVSISSSAPSTSLFSRAALPSRPLAPVDIQWSYAVHPGPGPEMSAQLIVAELMVLANTSLASYCASSGIAIPFRSSPRPLNTSRTPSHLTLERLLAARAPGTGVVDAYDVLKSEIYMAGSRVSTAPAEHWLVGVPAYTRGTSPLRRFDDLVVHWQIKAALARDAGLPSPFALLQADEVNEVVKRVEAAQRTAKFATKRADAFWRAAYISARLSGQANADTDAGEGATVDLVDPVEARAVAATIPASRAGKQTNVFVPALGTQATLVHTAGEYAIGDKVMVRIEGARQWPVPAIDVVPA
ncbi:3'-5' RNA exonuclease complex component [Cryptotrichosporon argae]